MTTDPRWWHEEQQRQAEREERLEDARAAQRTHRREQELLQAAMSGVREYVYSDRGVREFGVAGLRQKGNGFEVSSSDLEFYTITVKKLP